MKKIISIIISIVILVGGGIGLYFGVLRDDSPNLEVSVSNLTLNLNETKELIYSCSIKEAVISFEIADETIASVEFADGVANVTAHKVGNTTITIRANYKSFRNSGTARIFVVEDDNGGDGENTDALTFPTLYHMTFNESVFTANVGEVARFSITANFDINQINAITISPEVFEVQAIPNLSNTYQFTCDTAGSYTMTIRVNSNKVFTYTLIVE